MATKRLSPIVRKSNILCRSSWSPESIWEARLVALVASKIKPKDKDFHTYEIKMADVIPEADKGGTNYKIIDKATDYSMTRVIKIQNDETGGWDKYNLFSKCSYNPKKGTITVSFHPDLKTHYLNLQGHFARYELTQFLRLPSSYSQRLYEILKSWDDRSDVDIDLPSLHQMLDVPKSLVKDFTNFRRRVLEKAHKDIIKHTSFRYEWEAIKKGRKVIAVRFVFSPKKAKKIAAELDQDKRHRLQKEHNSIGLAAVKCWNEHDENCTNENPKTKKVCDVCKQFFDRPVKKELFNFPGSDAQLKPIKLRNGKTVKA